LHYFLQLSLTHIALFLANSRLALIKNLLIGGFLVKYSSIKMQEYMQVNPYAYTSFNDFFIRKIKPELRPIATLDTSLVSPADGYISEYGDIVSGRMFQAKNHTYTTSELLAGDDNLGTTFKNGSFCTVYLAPHNYHRVHAPYALTVTETIYVPGRLFSVNTKNSNKVDKLFARNERLIAIGDSDFGRIAIVFVGALIVGSITTDWLKDENPMRCKTIKKWQHDSIEYAKGAYLGHFSLGSTVIVLTEQQVKWEIQSSTDIKFGEMIAIGK